MTSQLLYKNAFLNQSNITKFSTMFRSFLNACILKFINRKFSLEYMNSSSNAITRFNFKKNNLIKKPLTAEAKMVSAQSIYQTLLVSFLAGKGKKCLRLDKKT